MFIFRYHPIKKKKMREIKRERERERERTCGYLLERQFTWAWSDSIDTRLP